MHRVGLRHPATGRVFWFELQYTIRMKARILTLLVITSVVALGNLHAQNASAVPATTAPPAAVTAAERKEATGIISDVTPERSLVLQTDADAGEPLVFRFAPEVTYVDEAGKVVEAPGLRKNLRIRVAYIKMGGDNVIDKVTILP